MGSEAAAAERGVDESGGGGSGWLRGVVAWDEVALVVVPDGVSCGVSSGVGGGVGPREVVGVGPSGVS